jgi:hypothetical protein
MLAGTDNGGPIGESQSGLRNRDRLVRDLRQARQQIQNRHRHT